MHPHKANPHHGVPANTNDVRMELLEALVHGIGVEDEEEDAQGEAGRAHLPWEAGQLIATGGVAAREAAPRVVGDVEAAPQELDDVEDRVRHQREPEYPGLDDMRDDRATKRKDDAQEA